MKPTAKKKTEVLKLLIDNKRDEKPVVLTAISEDLLSPGRNFINHVSKKNNPKVDAQKLNTKVPNPNISKSIAILMRLIEKETIRCAEQLHIDQEELEAWINVQIEVPAQTILALLRTAMDMRLDPLKEEITLIRYEDGNWQAHVSVDGWINILNRDEAFNGISFKESDKLIEGIPEWIECSIYLKDRTFPTTIREYFVESKSEHAIWEKMPRRMLRNRSLQQCAKLSFGSVEKICNKN